MVYPSHAIHQEETETLIDLRSDTVTKPTPGMIDAISSAKVGDDVWGDDPTVIALQEKSASLLGMEAALFLPSATQSNLASILSHCGRGEEYISGKNHHVYKYEAGGSSVLGGVVACPVAVDEGNTPIFEEVVASIKPDDPHFPVTRLICLENSCNGMLQPQEKLVRLSDLAKKSRLSVHLDGARLFNASLAAKKSVSELAAIADSVTICLSKGLGAPAGAVLAGSRDFIARAHRWRKMLGGGMRQSGILAAAGIYALDHHVERLENDHRNAKRLAEGLNAIDGISVDLEKTHTNMVFVSLNEGVSSSLTSLLREQCVVVDGYQGGNMRLVTHLHIDEHAVDYIINAFATSMDSLKSG